MIDISDPDTWKSRRRFSSDKSHYVGLDYDPAVEPDTPYCYDAASMIDGTLTEGCFSTADELFNAVEDKFGLTPVDFLAEE